MSEAEGRKGGRCRAIFTPVIRAGDGRTTSDWGCVVMNLFGQKPSHDPAVTARIKGWVREIMGFPDDVIVMVAELRCAEDDCPDVETVIAVLGEPGKARKHKLLKPMAEVTRYDVMSLAARGTHG